MQQSCSACPIDDYFPDYQLGCGLCILLNDSLAQEKRLIPITSGSISVNGRDIHDFGPVELRRKIGYVIQQTGLFPHMTIRRNLELVLYLHNLADCIIKLNT